MKNLLNTVLEKNILSKEQAQLAISGLLEGELSNLQMGALLAAMRIRGESASEIAGFAETLLQKASLLPNPPENCLDVCGTGGDGRNTFNISTAVSLTVAAGGIPVAKHGNRSVSSLCGSADVLEALVVATDLTPQQASIELRENNFAFLYAPHYHPAFKKIAPLRKELGVRTLFNLLGPLLNPARTKTQVIGVFSKQFLRPMAEALDILGVQNAMVLSSRDGMDEVSLDALTDVVQLKKGVLTELTIDPQELGLAKTTADELKGGDVATNTEILLQLFAGEKGARQDIVALNASLAFLLAGKCSSLEEGISLAKELLSSGAVLQLLKKIRGSKCTLS